MADQPHDAGDLGGCGHAPDLALGADGRGQAILVGLEDGGLVQTDGRSVDVHVQKDDVEVGDAVRQTEVVRHGEGGVQKDVVHLPMSSPELAVEIVFTVVLLRSMQVQQVSTEQGSHEDDAGVGRQRHVTGRGQGVLECTGPLRLAHVKGLLARWQIRQDLARR